MKHIKNPVPAIAAAFVLAGCGTTREATMVNQPEIEIGNDATDDGARRITLRNGQGMEVELMELGATVTRVVVPDRDGRPTDVVLGFDTIEEYPEKSQYFGCTVGRVGNRIANGFFELDGRGYELARNNGLLVVKNRKM